MNKTICLFTAEFPYGQQETFLETELAFLSEKFDEVYIVPLFKHSSLRFLKFKNVKVMPPVNDARRVSIGSLLSLSYLSFITAFFWGLMEGWGGTLKLIKVFKQAYIVGKLKNYLNERTSLQKMDLWYFYWGTNSISVLPFLKSHPNAVARYHGYDLYGPEVRVNEYQVLQKKSSSRLSKAFFVTDDGQRYFKEKYGERFIPTEVSKLGVVDTGICEKSSDGVLRIVTCSNLNSVKRVHLVAEALLEISDIQIEWTHFGDGSAEFRNKVLMHIPHLDEHISFNFKGRVKNHEVINFYQTNPVDLFINVSESEGLPVSIMEALSFSIPVLATKVGGTEELVDELNGTLISSKLTGAMLAQQIIRFYNEDFGNSSKRVAARNAWKQKVSANHNYSKFTESLKKI